MTPLKVGQIAAHTGQILCQNLNKMSGQRGWTSIILCIDPSGEVFVGSVGLDIDEVQNVFEQMAQQNPQEEVRDQNNG